MLRIEILFDKNSPNKPNLAILEALETQIDKQLAKQYDDYHIRIALSSSQSLNIFGTKNKEEKEQINQILENIWQDDSWLPEA